MLRANSPLPENVTADVRDLLARGHKINAIKVMREATGMGLRDAKDAVERIEAESN